MKGGHRGILDGTKNRTSRQGLAKNKQRFLYPHPSGDKSHCRCTRKVPLSLYLHKKLLTSEGSGLISTNSTNTLSPSYRDSYFPARLYRIMSRGSQNAELESGGLEIGISVRIRRDTLESWVLVMVERHFSTNFEGRTGSS